jgi:hypothetical protein
MCVVPSFWHAGTAVDHEHDGLQQSQYRVAKPWLPVIGGFSEPELLVPPIARVPPLLATPPAGRVPPLFATPPDARLVVPPVVLFDVTEAPLVDAPPSWVGCVPLEPPETAVSGSPCRSVFAAPEAPQPAVCHGPATTSAPNIKRGNASAKSQTAIQRACARQVMRSTSVLPQGDSIAQVSQVTRAIGAIHVGIAALHEEPPCINLLDCANRLIHE